MMNVYYNYEDVVEHLFAMYDVTSIYELSQEYDHVIDVLRTIKEVFDEDTKYVVIECDTSGFYYFEDCTENFVSVIQLMHDENYTLEYSLDRVGYQV